MRKIIIHDNVQYLTYIQHQVFHTQLKKKYGSAKRCESCRTKNPKAKFHWCLKRGHHYSSEKKDYRQMCAQCHKSYDFNWRKYKTHKLCNYPAWEIRNLIRCKKRMSKEAENNILYRDLLKIMEEDNQVRLDFIERHKTLT